MAPSGFFCMSGPVAHADDDEDKYGYEYPETQKITSLHASPLHLKSSSNAKQNAYLAKLSKDNGDEVRWRNGDNAQGHIKYICSDGMGKIIWSSGSVYNGEVMDGSLHGIGTYRGAGGTVYQGNWILNKKHGFGRKMYKNGDVYEGFWKSDVPEGQGRYLWSDGNEYIGDWQNGKMCGAGVLKWASGDSYDGQWLNGLPDGYGIYTWANGSIYVGTWRKGSRCGIGRIISPEKKHKEILSLPDAGIDSKMLTVIGNNCLNNNCHSVVPPVQRPMTWNENFSAEKSITDMIFPGGDNGLEHKLVYDKMQMLPDGCGDDCCETSPEIDLHDSFFARPSAFQNEIQIGMVSETESDNCSQKLEFQKRTGEYISKGHRSYNLVLALQLGIRYSVTEASYCASRELSSVDFGPKAIKRFDFCRGDSLPYHLSAGFQWTDYCPAVFRNLRGLFKVDSEDYILSICGSGNFRELPSPGKSGCIFYLSQDEHFMIKTLRKTEVKVLLKMLPEYYNHVCMYKNTLLTKFFGVHCVKLPGGQKVRFVVMGNIVSSDSQIHKIFDLKGSSEGRTTNKFETNGNAILKDLDLDIVFHLDPCSRERMLEQIRIDCHFLESQHIMDYSLLLGVHFKDRSPKFLSSSPGYTEDTDDTIVFTSLSVNGTAVQQIEEDTAFHRFGRKRSVKVDAKDVDRLPTDTRKHMQLGLKMQAKSCKSNWQRNHISCSEVHEIVLHMGIIDILQEYDWSKKLEHAYKSIQSKPLSISAVDPTLYSMRFQHFLHQIFVLSKSSLNDSDDG